MNVFRKKIFIVLFLGLVFAVFGFCRPASAQEKIEINFFFSKTCPHCAKEEEFLEKLETKYPEIRINKFLADQKNVELLKKFYQDYQVPENVWGWVPITFVGDKYFLGFNEETGRDIENCVSRLIEDSQESCQPENSQGRISLPFIGEIDVSKFSPLALAVILGGLDGFNVCAMVALGFLLAVLVATGIRKRVFLIGGTFIFVSGLVYFLFISAWLNLFLVLEKIQLITYLIGAIIVLSAIFLLKDYFHGAVCKLCQVEPGRGGALARFERKLFEKMERISSSKMSLPLILLGVAIVAAGVNLVELVCSFGFPLAFTKILAGLNLPVSRYYFYLLVYIIFYMLDDFLIFAFAVLTLRITQTSQKYLKAIKLISGILLLALGILLLFWPEVLTV